MPIVYRHRRLDSNEVFYIGMGSEEKRAYSKVNRNQHWKCIINKTDYQVEIIATDLDYEDALELEVLLIEQYGRRDLGLGPLVNMTDGGQGGKGRKHSIKTKEKMKIAQNNLSPENKRNKSIKLSIANKGKILSDKHKQILCEVNKGKILSEETKNKMSLAKQNMSQEIKDKIGLGHKGKKHSKERIEERIKKLNKKVINIETKIIYDSIKDTPESLIYKIHTLRCMLNGQNNNKTNLRYFDISKQK